MIYAWHYAVALLLAIGGAAVFPRCRWAHVAPRGALAVWQALVLTSTVSPVGVLMAAGLEPYHRGIVPGLICFTRGLVSVHSRPRPGAGQDAAVAAGLLLAAWIGAAWARCAIGARRLRRRHRLLLSLVGTHDPAAGAGATVLDHPAPAAYCLPGRHPAIILSRGALDALDQAQLAAVLAHERAHLAERHDLLLLPAAALRRAFPRGRLIRRAHDAVALLVEMRADDWAAAQSWREDLARALGTFRALGVEGPPDGAMAAAASDLGMRIDRLRCPGDRPPAAARIALLVLAAALALTPLSLIALPV